MGHNSESRTTADRMTWLIREVSSHPKYGYLVGRDCLSVVIHPNSPAMPTHYHPDKATTVEYGPHLVTPMFSTWDVEFDLDPQPLDLAAPIELPLITSHRNTSGGARERNAVAPDYLGNESVRSDLWEDYLHLYPRTEQSWEEMTGMEADEEGATLRTRIRGKLIGDAGYDDVQNGDYLQRVDAIPRDKVSERTQEQAREAARTDTQPYLE